MLQREDLTQGQQGIIREAVKLLGVGERVTETPEFHGGAVCSYCVLFYTYANGEGFAKSFPEADGWRMYGDRHYDDWELFTLVHLEERVVLRFSDGDVKLVLCPDDVSYRNTLGEISFMYGEPVPPELLPESMQV